ncbi:hypothetical protein KVV02_003736 [Mortierella alpina]|uniref:NET domain-containing protein n=1 Tax=Mortierella alpina TaxID=64518 RepID=A0A9P8A3Z6_MORAP|nr:hypothetical protein KVV02_003736 [Mortierella alpina]
MGGITLADSPPDDPEGSLALPAGLYNPSLLKDLAWLNFATSSPTGNAATATSAVSNVADIASETQTTNAGPSFCISDFLVPGLQTKVWEDWQSADDLNDFTGNGAFESQDYSDFNGLQFGLDGLVGNTPVWDNSAVPVDQAYDELVFDLSPSAFETPTTVNVADLIVGPDSMAAAAGASSVSPLDLSMSSVSTYQDLALASLYGFTEPSAAFESDSGSDSEDEEDEEDEDEDEYEDQVKIMGDKTEQGSMKAVTEPLTTQLPALTTEAMAVDTETSQQAATPVSKPEDPNKRRMEEALVARISNDLGPEHMAGLFEILKGSNGHADGDDEDEEMEVDLSCLDETTLVQVYQYVETCCMQTMGSILAEERKRTAMATAAVEKAALESRRSQLYAERTPELSPGHTSGSSSSPSPPHPSCIPSSPMKGRRRSNSGNKKRSPGYSPYPAPFQPADDIEQDALWTSGLPSKSRRNRSGSNAAVAVGGGGAGKGRRIQKDQYHETMQQYSQQQGAVATEAVILCAAAVDEVGVEFGEEDEIDVVGI